MAERRWIVHLLGFPAVGKRTVAVELVARAARHGGRFVLLDNHLTSNPILAVLGHGGTGFVGEEVWDLVGEVRDVQDRAIVALARPEQSFVFTNAAMAGEARGTRAVDRLRRLAEACDRTYVPVVLRCDLPELLERVPSADRAAHGKWIAPAEVAAHVEGHLPFAPGEPHVLELDTTDTAPGACAEAILAHLAEIEVARA